MSSQSKRRAESEEVTHKKKPRKGGDEDEELNQDEYDNGLEVVADDLGALDEDNISTERRTRGKRVDYTEGLEGGGLGNDNGFEAGKEAPKEKNEAPAGPRTRSPQRNPTAHIEENEEDDDEDDEEEEYDGGDGEDEDDDGTEDYEEDEEE